MIEKRRFAFELMIGWMVRIYNQFALVFPVILLSLMALKCRIPKLFWSVLSRVRLLYDEKFTKQLALDLGQRIQLPRNYPGNASRLIGIGTFDNCLMKFLTSYEGVRSGGDGNVNYNFVNWFTSPVHEDDIPAGLASQLDSPWDELITNEVVIGWIDDSEGILEHLETDWTHFTTADSVLDHPEYASNRPKMIYQNHVPTINGTAGYDDVRKVLFVIIQLMVVTLGISYVFVIGDQQSYSRVVWLLRSEPENFRQIIPFPGDFHFAVHALMAIHILWWKYLVEDLLWRSQFDVSSIHETWDRVDLYNRHRHCYETVIVAILAYVTEVFSTEDLADPVALMETVSANNGGMTSLLHFLYDFGLPWLGFRNAIRGNNSVKMDSMYCICLDWYRVAGKYLYARICVDHIWITTNLKASFLQVWHRYRTVSKLGNAGRNIPRDQANEFENLELKQWNPKDPSNIDPTLTMLNGLREIDEPMRSLFGVQRDPLREYTATKQNQVDAIVDILRTRLGTNPRVFLRPTRGQIKRNNPFGSGIRPWIRVEASRQTRNEYVRRQLETPPMFL